QALVYRNGTEVRRDPDFHHDLDRLIHHLGETVARMVKPAALRIGEGPRKTQEGTRRLLGVPASAWRTLRTACFRACWCFLWLSASPSPLRCPVFRHFRHFFRTLP